MVQHHQILEQLSIWQQNLRGDLPQAYNSPSTMRIAHHTFISQLLEKLAALDPALLNTHAQDCLLPVQLTDEALLDAFIAPQGKSSGGSGLYVSFRPGYSFIGLGYMKNSFVNGFAWHEEKKLHQEELEYMLHFLTSYCGFELLTGTAPLNSPEKHRLINLGLEINDLRPRLLFKYIPHEELLDSQLEYWITQQYGLLLSYNQYLNRALDFYAHVSLDELEDYVDLP